MDPVNIGTIIVALIAAASAWASQRSAARAAVQNTVTGGRVDMEKDAYDRARKFDTDTITRQDNEIAELRALHDQCNGRLEVLKAAHEEEVKGLRDRISRIEHDGILTMEEIIRERLRDRQHNERASDPNDPE